MNTSNQFQQIIVFLEGDGFVPVLEKLAMMLVSSRMVNGAGTIELLVRSLGTGGTILIGELYWRQLPPAEDVAKGCLANSISDFLMLPELLASFGHPDFDVDEVVMGWRTRRPWICSPT